MTLIQYLDRFPPVLCRLLARKKHGLRPMTNCNIAFVSGLSLRTVARLSQLRSWRGVTIDVIQKFSMACGVNLVGNKRYHLRFIRSHMKAVYRNATPIQKKMLDRLNSYLK